MKETMRTEMREKNKNDNVAKCFLFFHIYFFIYVD